MGDALTRQTRMRLLLKAASWRVIGSLIGGVIVVLMSGELTQGKTFLSAAIPLQMFFYYLHERGWELIR